MPILEKLLENTPITKQKILLKIVKYFVGKGPNVFVHLKKHYELMKVLKPFKNSDLISFRTYAIYLFSYVSRSLNNEEKLQILTYNYSFLKNVFPAHRLMQLFKEGIEFYKEKSEQDEYSVILSSSSILEFEGSLSLFFKVNDVKVFTLSFTFAQGKVFNVADKTVIYVSCLQGVTNQYEKISKATKYFNDIIPSVIVLKVLEAFAVSLNINKILGISAKDQLSYGNELDYDNFYSNYDQFWKNSGGELVNGNYVISCPMTQKSILLVKQNHRNRTLKKRRRLTEIYHNCYCNIQNVLILPLLDNIAYNLAPSFSIAKMSLN